jgi:ornithine carbamoyltransferase
MVVHSTSEKADLTATASRSSYTQVSFTPRPTARLELRTASALVVGSPACIVFSQAESRMHTNNAALLSSLGS